MDSVVKRRMGRKAQATRRAALDLAMAEMLERRTFFSASTDVSGTLPALFVKNEGQWADYIRYAFQNGAGNIMMTDYGPLFQLVKNAGTADVTSEQFLVRFDGANKVTPKGSDKSSVKYNYFIGDQSTWRDGVSGYETITYKGLYAGIDLVTWGQRNALKYEFHVAPGADPSKVKISYVGAQGLAIDSSGDLHIKTKLGKFIDDAPFVYQVINGKKVAIQSKFKLVDGDTYTFELTGNYDKSKELILDPFLDFGTYIGGSAADTVESVVTDQQREDGISEYVYITGRTASGLNQVAPFPGFEDFFLINPAYNQGFQQGIRGTDTYVAKFDLGGSIKWVTFVGGRNNENVNDIAVDSTGVPYIVGSTNSSDFAFLSTTTPGYKTIYGTNNTNGGTDGFLIRFNHEGFLTYGSLIAPPTSGGSNEQVHSIDIDDDDFVYIAGQTSSNDTWALNTTIGDGDLHSVNGTGNDDDGFVAKMDLNRVGQAQLLWLKFVGGGSDDSAQGVSVAADGTVWVVGTTESSDFLTSIDAPIFERPGDEDIMIARINQAATLGSDGLPPPAGELPPGPVITQFATYWGGAEDDDSGVAIDADPITGDVVITGQTASSDFPVFNPIDDLTTSPLVEGEELRGNADAYVLRFDDAFPTVPILSSYFGGAGNGDIGNDIIFDSHGNFIVVGATNSNDFIPSHFLAGRGLGAFVRGGTDAFIARFDVASSLINTDPDSEAYAVLFGGAGADSALGVTVDSLNGVVVVGSTTSDDLLLDQAGTALPTLVDPLLIFEDQFAQGDANATASDGFLMHIVDDDDQSVPNQPTNLRAVAVSLSQINLTWNDNANNELGYFVERKRGAGGTWTRIATLGFNAKSYSNTTGLAPDTKYYYRVQAFNSAGLSLYSNNANATTTTAALATPTSLQATTVSSSRIDLTWNDNANNETNYLVFRALTDGGDFAQIATLPAGTTEYEDEGLDPDTSYTYRVQAINGSRSSTFSNPAIAATRANGFLIAPTSLVATPEGDEVILTWDDNSSNEDGYAIERAEVGEGLFSQIAATGPNDETYTDDTIDPNKLYLYRIRAFNSINLSAYSNTATSDLERALGTPRLFEARAISSTAITLTWNDKSLIETGFVIERGINGPDFDVIATVAANSTSYTNRNLSANTKYVYRIRATDGTSFSKYTPNVTVFTLPSGVTPPAAPSSLKATPLTTTSIKLNWRDNSSNETAFAIERSTSRDGPFAVVDTVSRNIRTYTDTGLTENKVYFYRVRARLGTARSAATPVVQTQALARPRVTIKASDSSGNESGDKLVFTVGRKDNLVGDLIVKYTIAGSATNGSDYNSISGTVTIPDGKASAKVTITPKDDTKVEGNENIKLTLAANDAYRISPSMKTATGTLADNDFSAAKTASTSLKTPFSSRALSYDVRHLSDLV